MAITCTPAAKSAGWAASQSAKAAAERPATRSSSRAGPAVADRGEVDDQRDEPGRPDASGCPAMLIDADHAHPGQPIRPAAAIRSATARIAIELTVCQDTPNSAAMAETVVRSIINRRNT